MNESHLSHSGWTKTCPAHLCALYPSVFLHGVPFTTLPHSHWQNSTLISRELDFFFLISILPSFLSPLGRLRCFFLHASLSSCTYLHYNNYHFTLYLTFYLSGKLPWVEGRDHFLFISVYPVSTQGVAYHFAHMTGSFPPPLMPLRSLSWQRESFIFPP